NDPHPDGVAMYCLPFTAYEMGPPLWPEPVWKFQRVLPVRASSAEKLPSGSPVNNRSPAVDSNAPRCGYFVSIRHARRPVTGSNASMCDVTFPEGGGTNLNVPPCHALPITISCVRVRISVHHSMAVL